MKKILAISIVALMIMLVAVTTVKATTEDELREYLTGTLTVNGEEVEIPAQYITSIERYLDSNDLTDEQATAIKAKVDQGLALMAEEGVTDPNDLSKAKKSELLSVGQEAASVVGLKLQYDSSDATISVLDANGKVIDSFSTNTSKLVQTGSSNILYVALAGVAIIAVAAIASTKRAKVNA